MAHKTVVVIGSLLLNAAFFETALYYALLHRQPRVTLDAIWSEIAMASLIGWLLLLLALFLDRRRFAAILARIRTWLADVLKAAREAASLLLFLIPTLFLAVLLLRKSWADHIADVGEEKIIELMALIAVWAFVAVLAWCVTWLIRQFRGTRGSDLAAALDDWSWSVRLSTVYYVFVAATSWYLLRPSSVPAAARAVVYSSLVKDLFLMWIIAELLFASLFKLREAGQLGNVFRSVPGYLQFVLVCALVALIAIAADFYYLASAQAERLYPNVWQRDLMQVHTFGRDLGLLLLPIAGLLVWTLRGLAAELRANPATP